MDHFHYHKGVYHAENVPVPDICEAVGTPTYIYSRATFERHWHAFHDALSEQAHMICYSVKANGSLAVLNLMARLGSGFDVVSGGELERVVAAGGDPSKVVFSGVAKTHQEIDRALDLNVFCFNVESRDELTRIENIARDKHIKAPIALRVNPDVDAKTHPYISTGLKDNKFGIPFDKVLPLYLEAAESPYINVIGAACHIGSQLTDLAPFLDTLERMQCLIDDLKNANITLSHLDLGGGLGVCYQNETPPHPSDYAAAINEQLRHKELTIVLEPGRAIAANAGILVTRVEYLKDNAGKHFVIVDAGMNDLMRPALYQAWHDILPVVEATEQPERTVDIVGPVCESADRFASERQLATSEGDLLVIRSAGAYGFSMASHYNTRPKPAEVMVDEDHFVVIRPRECVEDLFSTEICLPKENVR